MHRYRSHTCGELRAADVDTDVRLSGWAEPVCSGELSPDLLAALADLSE